MPVSVGTVLGHYKILAPLGAGGMGEVYRASDSRLGREIALKILPQTLSRDSSLRARFEQEARAASALNHPNIVSIYDIGQQEETQYIVSELVDGEPLRSLISRGPVPARKIIDLGRQIAEGLAAAHSAKIIHRDLKPENILITHDGRVKIIDFGLAKQMFQGSPEDTVPGTLTMPGTVMGTIGYMSPEQIRAQPLDSRSDIFSLGVILYEMAAGRNAFTGESGADVMSAILMADPPELRVADLPPGLVFTIRRCLEKNPALRFQSASDLAFAINSLSSLPAATAPAQLPAVANATVEIKPPTRSLSWLAWAVPVLCIAGGAGYWLSTQRRPAPAPPPVSNAQPAPIPTPPVAVQQVKPSAPPPQKKQEKVAVAEKPATPNVVAPEPPKVEPASAPADERPFDRAQKLNADGKYDQAIKAFDGVIRMRPKYALAFVGRGNAYLHQKQLDLALSDFNEAIRLKPDMHFAYVDRGHLYNQKGEYQLAIKDFDEAIRLHPDNARAYEGRALAKGKTGDRKGAAADRKQAAVLRK